MEQVLTALAAAAEKDPAEVLAGARERIAAKVAALDRLIAEHEQTEATVSAEMRAARETVLAAGVYADGDALERVLRVESHLTRQLTQTLNLLDRLRGDAEPAGAVVRLRRLVASG